MRAIHLARLDKVRPVLILTRERVLRSAMSKVTIAPITSTIRGLESEVAVGLHNGLDRASVISCDNLATIEKTLLGRAIGFLLADQEADLTRALHAAFDLEDL